MKAQLLGFFSGFPTHHFPADIVERLKEDSSRKIKLYL